MTPRSAKRTTPLGGKMSKPRRSDLQINLADRALGWIIPGFIGAAVIAAVFAVYTQVIGPALNHLTQILP